MDLKLLSEAQRLPVEERIELAEAIWDTVSEDAESEVLAVPASHRLGLDRRLADLEADPNAGSTWDEIRERLEQEA